MNNLVFNTVATELKTSIFGLAPDLSTQPIRVDNSGNLLVAGTFTMPDTITVSAIESTVTVEGSVTITNASLTVAGEVEITNASLTVAGTVTVAEISSPVTVSGAVTINNASITVEGTVTVDAITSPVTIGNASLTVNGEVEITNASLTVAGTVTVAEISSPVTVSGSVTINNASITVEGTVTVSAITSNVDVNPITIGANAFFEDDETLEATGTDVIFDNTDISNFRVVSVFVYNLGPSPLTISLQISPTTGSAFYIDDPNYTDVVVEPNESAYMSVSLYAHYFRLQYNMGGDATSVSAYYIAQA